MSFIVNGTEIKKFLVVKDGTTTEIEKFYDNSTLVFQNKIRVTEEVTLYDPTVGSALTQGFNYQWTPKGEIVQIIGAVCKDAFHYFSAVGYYTTYTQKSEVPIGSYFVFTENTDKTYSVKRYVNLNSSSSSMPYDTSKSVGKTKPTNSMFIKFEVTYEYKP